jgi:hypothetical protein
MVYNLTGTVDLNTCVAVVNNIISNQITPLIVATSIVSLAFIVVLALWATKYEELRLMKDFLRRESQLNKYENWKKDRYIR